MDKEKQRPEKRHLKLVDRYDSDDYSRYGGPDYSDEVFELGEQDFEHSPHSKRDIRLRETGTWTNPGVSGKSESGDTWVNQKEYKKQADFVGFGPRGYKRSDDRIYEEVCEELMRNPDVDASNIGVKVEQGKVYLTGKVASRKMKKISELVIADLPGVQDVFNELAIFKGDQNPKGPDKATKKDLGLT